MMLEFKHCLLVALLTPFSIVQAAELTGRFSLLGTIGQSEQGELGFTYPDNKNLTADQQSLRLMLDGLQDNGEWSIHIKTLRQHMDGYPAYGFNYTNLFRYRELSHDWLDEKNANDATRIGYELDRINYKYRLGNITVGLGRQAIDWGSGRFWQPLNVFGAFSPTDLDTDFKPGIDAAVLNWYPSAFSSLTIAYVLAPQDNTAIKDSGAIHYRRQIGATSEITLLAGSVIGNKVVGASFESDWNGMGWRIEGVQTYIEQRNERALFWIAGIDYQFTDGTLITMEWYDNNRGINNQPSLANMETNILIKYGLQQQLGRNVLGILVDRDITPLLHCSYTMLVSPMSDGDNEFSSSILHQLNFIYSVSNESDLLLSLLYENGNGFDQAGEPQSEFGRVPLSMTMRLRLYF